MTTKPPPGLGELLRYVGELVDRGAEQVYDDLGMSYRARYTPVLRAMGTGAVTVTDITSAAHLTQGAISQTVGLMVTDGLIVRTKLDDGRKSGLALTSAGRALVERLEPHWAATFAAIAGLEREIGYPLRRALGDAARALERRGFGDRIVEAGRAEPAEPKVARNWFNDDGQAYARFRPEYPERLAMFLASVAPTADVAVDVGCGSGQLTAQLAEYFRQTIGVDPSAAQIEFARARDGVEYVRGPAEALPVADHSASLITAAQAAHWFDRPAFYAEVRRIAAEGAVVALISYGVMRFEPEIAERFKVFYRDQIGPYWPPERALVDSGYADIDFPFEELPAPPVQIVKHWNLHETLGYISTWSAVRGVREAGQTAILREFAADLEALWGEPSASRPISWPINMRLGVIR